MVEKNIDYHALKKRGFLRQKQEGYFTVRTRMGLGKFSAEQLSALSEVTRKYANGFAHLTTRQGVEIPFIKLENIESVERELRKGNIEFGASGATLRTITVCPGNNWCRFGLIDTFKLLERIEKEINLDCNMELPHKFKIAISGCPNSCTRPQVSEIGIHGEVATKDSGRRIGYRVYIGGCGGRNPRTGFRVDKIFSDTEVLEMIAKVVNFFKNNAKPRQRLALLIEEIGKENFLRQLGL